MRFKNNPEQYKAARKRWRLNRPEWFKHQNEKWREERKQLTKEWRVNNKERHRVNRRKGVKAHAARHPERDFSRRVLRLAVRYGIVVREPCVVCGSPKTEAHHTDYFKPLDVIWVCQPHHQEIHRAAR